MDTCSHRSIAACRCPEFFRSHPTHPSTIRHACSSGSFIAPPGHKPSSDKSPPACGRTKTPIEYSLDSLSETKASVAKKLRTIDNADKPPKEIHLTLYNFVANYHVERLSNTSFWPQFAAQILIGGFDPQICHFPAWETGSLDPREYSWMTNDILFCSTVWAGCTNLARWTDRQTTLRQNLSQ